MTTFFYGFLFWIPMIIIIIGLLLMLPSVKKTYSYKKKKTMRQIIGKFIFYVGIIVSVFQFGANKQHWFYKTPNNQYIYKCLMFGDTTLSLSSDSIMTDSIPSQNVTLYKDTVIGGVSLSIQHDTITSNYYIPFENSNGCKVIKLKIKDLTVDAYFDTGCGYKIAFCPKDYYKIVGTGIIKEDEFTRQSESTIADGSTSHDYVFNLPECTIGNIRFKNFEAVCTENGEATLVGSPLFEHFKSYVVDNKNMKIILNK